jgi:hypothetical protein
MQNVDILKKFTCKGTLRHVYFCLRPPPHLGFCLGWSRNFVGSESGQVESVKLLKNIVSNRMHTVYVLYIQYNYSHREGGEGELNQREG